MFIFTSSAISSVITTCDSDLRFCKIIEGILSNSKFVIFVLVGIKLAITNASTAAELFAVEEIELFIVVEILLFELVEETELVSSSKLLSFKYFVLLGKLSLSQSITVVDKVHGEVGVMIFIVVGFLTVVSVELITDALFGWYEDITELFVMDVVDLDLCHKRGLAEGPANPILFISILVTNVKKKFFFCYVDIT